MRHAQPPLVATWILERFCTDEALAGDLVEQYQSRRSVTRYWRQTLSAVAVYSTSQIREHKWLTVRAIATGLGIWVVFNNMLLKGVLQPWMDTTALRVAYLLLGYVIWMANGWLIARLHRPYPTAMVLAYVVWSTVASVPVIGPLVVGALADPSVRPSLAWEVAARSVTLLSIMAGGMLAVRRDRARAIRHHDAHRLVS